MLPPLSPVHIYGNVLFACVFNVTAQGKRFFEVIAILIELRVNDRYLFTLQYQVVIPQKRPFPENGPWVNVAALCSLYVAHYSFLYLGGRNTAQYSFRIAEKSSLSSRYLYLAQKGSKTSKLAILLPFWARKRCLDDRGDFLEILKENCAVLRLPRYKRE